MNILTPLENCLSEIIKFHHPAIVNVIVEDIVTQIVNKIFVELNITDEATKTAITQKVMDMLHELQF